MQRQITKVKLTDTFRLHAEYLEYPAMGDDEGIGPDKCVREGDHEAHPDLVAAFNELRPHMATICEQGQMTEFEEDTEKLDIFLVTGVTFSGDDDHEGVTITGQRRLKTNKVLNLNTPFTKIHPDHSDYSYAQSLNLALENLRAEADQYLSGEKFAPKRQMEFDFDAESQEKPKKKGRGKSRKLKVDISAEVDQLSEAVGE